jgi:hypothetical protein
MDGSDSPPPRALFTDERGAGMRLTWHAGRTPSDLLVLSLWRADVCIGTFRMAPAEAARLASFIVDHLGRAAVGQGATRSRNSVTEAS